MILDLKIKTEIESKIGSELHSVSSLSGGCISNAYKIIDDRERIYFLKINSSLKDLFIKEANGLNELRKANAIKVPEVFFCTEDYLLAEFVLQDKPSKNFFENFGRSFAELHKFKGEKFGFFEDNYIGSNPQINISGPGEESNWSEFYFNKRIFFQYKLAEKNGYATKELKDVILQLENKIEKIIETTNEAPSILHGDLWSGNFLVAQNNNACLIDPAVYYGHREADLAMTKLFGGFSSEFYSSYNEVYPLEKDYEYRENIYKLYHVLNHLNLFGKSYYPQSISMIKTYLK